MAGQQGLKRFSAQVSYTVNNGYGCTVGFKGDGKSATPAEAILALIVECGIAAVRAGCDDVAIGTLGSTVEDARAALAKADGQ